MVSLKQNFFKEDDSFYFQGLRGDIGPPGIKVNLSSHLYYFDKSFQGEKGDQSKGEKGERGSLGLPGYTMV